MFFDSVWLVVTSAIVAANVVSNSAVLQSNSYVLTRNTSLTAADMSWIYGRVKTCAIPSVVSPSTMPRLLQMTTSSTLYLILSLLTLIEDGMEAATNSVILGGDLTGKEKRVIADVLKNLETNVIDVEAKNFEPSSDEYAVPIVSFLRRHRIMEVSLLISDDERGADFASSMLLYSLSNRWSIVSVTMLGMANDVGDVSEVLSTHPSTSEIKIICCSFESAHKVLSTYPEFGFSGLLNKEYSWMLALQDEVVVGKDVLLWERLIAYCPIASDAVKIEANNFTHQCLQRQQLERANFYQLWGNQLNGGKRQWDLIDTWIKGDERHDTTTMSRDLFTNPLTPQIRVAIAPYLPWVIIEDLEPGEVCSTGSKLGHRFIHDTSNATTPICAYGFAIDILDNLEKELRFTSRIYQVRDNSFGAFNETTKTWNGIVNEILQDRADVAIDLSMTNTRTAYIEFGTPYTGAGTGILYSKKVAQGITVNAMGIAGPFDNTLWVCFIASILLTAFILWGLDRLSPYGRDRTALLGYRSKGAPLYTIEHSLTCTWGMFTSGEIVDSRPRSLSARITMVVVSFVATVVVAIYSANLMAFLITTDDLIPLRNIRDPRLSDPRYNIKMATVAGTSDEDFFRNSKDPYLRSLHERMREHNVATYTEGVRKLRSGVIDAFVGSNPSLTYTASKDNTCSLKTVGEEYGASGVSIAFAKNSPWKASLLNAISKISGNGAAEETYLKWFSASSCTKEMTFLPLSFHHMAIAFAFLGGFASLIIVLQAGWLIGSRSVREARHCFQDRCALSHS